MNLMRIATVALLVLVVRGSASAGTITLWNFNSGTLATSVGTGSMAVRNLPTSPSKFDTDLGDWDDTRTENDSSDPAPIQYAGTPLHARGYRIEWGKETGTAGNEYGCWTLDNPPGHEALIWKVSTVGQSNIHVRMDVRVKSYNPGYFQIQYSTDGVNFITYPKWFQCHLPQEQASWFNHNEIDLSGIPAVNNNPNFAFAFVMAYGPGKTAYEPSWQNPIDPNLDPKGAWAPWPYEYARWAFDMVEVYSGASSIVDTTAPIINAVFATQAAAPNTMHIQTVATDNAVVGSVTANGVGLSRTGLYTWDGDIPGNGSTVVNVVATDDSGNTTTRSRTGFTQTVAVLSTFVKYDEWGNPLLNPIFCPAYPTGQAGFTSTGCYKWVYRVFGEVKNIYGADHSVDPNYFTINTSCGDTLIVFAPGHGLVDGDHAEATGVMTPSTLSTPYLTSDAAHLRKY